MRTMLAAFALALGLTMVADLAFASIYVPGEIRDGIYIRPHFIASPKSKLEDAWPGQRLIPAPDARKAGPPVPGVAPSPHGGLGEGF